MADLAIQPGVGAGNKLFIKTQDGTSVLETSDSGADYVGTTKGTIDSTATFPSGMIIKRTSYYTEPSSNSAVAGTSFIDTGIELSFTTATSSANSYLMIHCCNSYAGNNNTDAQGWVTMQLTASSDTSYDTADDLLATAQTDQWFMYDTNTLNKMPINMVFYFKAGTNTTTNKTSYSASETLYARFFMKSSHAIHPFYFTLAGGSTTVWVDEVQI